MTQGTARSRWRKWLIACASIVASLLVLEGLLALFGVSVPKPPVYLGEIEPVRDSGFDPRIGWKLPPGESIVETTEDYTVTYHTNAQGFRSRHDFAEPAAGRRIVFLGDSYTFGSGVEDGETFASLVEERRPDTRAYNLGIGAFGVDQMWQTLVHYGLPLKPDLVVVSFIRQDLDRSLSSYRLDHAWRWKPAYRLDEGRLEPVTADDRPAAALRFLERNSRLLGLCRRVEYSLSRRYAIGDRWRLNRAIFAAMRDACAEASTKLVVVHIPVNRRHPAPVFAKEFADMGIEFLDLTPLLPPAADEFYYPNDHHLNALGHWFVAESIDGFLDRRGLLR